MNKATTIKSTRNYYNEEKVQQLLKEYQKTTIIKDKVVIKKNPVLEEEIVLEVKKIVKAIISVYKYYAFEDYDDLMQHGLNACYTNFVKFTPAKGTSFNFFSLIAKISLLNYTTRKSKHRNHYDITEQVSLESKAAVNYEEFFENLENTLFEIINENLIGEKRKEYLKIASVLLNYFRLNKKLVSKSDLYSFSRSYGIKNTQVRHFIKDISNNYNVELFKGVI